MNQFSIQRLTPGDEPLLHALLLAWEHDEGNFNAKLPGTPHLQSILNRPDIGIWVAEVGGEVVGGITAYDLPMIGEETRELFLYEIGVIAGHRRSGIARALIEALKAHARAQGISVIFVATSLDNDAARQLYESTGGELEIIPWFTYNL